MKSLLDRLRWKLIVTLRGVETGIRRDVEITDTVIYTLVLILVVLVW